MARRNSKGKQRMPTQAKVSGDSEHILDLFLTRKGSTGENQKSSRHSDAVDGALPVSGQTAYGHDTTDSGPLPSQRGQFSPRRRTVHASAESYIQVTSQADHKTVIREENIAHFQTDRRHSHQSAGHTSDVKKGKLSRMVRTGKRVVAHLRPGKSKSYDIKNLDSRSSSQETISKPESKRSRVCEEVDSVDEADTIYIHESIEIDGLDDIGNTDQLDSSTGTKVKSKPGLLSSIHRRFSLRRIGRKRSKESKCESIGVDDVDFGGNLTFRRSVHLDGTHSKVEQTTSVNVQAGKQDVIAEVADRLAEIGDQVMITRQHSLPPEELNYSSFVDMVGQQTVSSWRHVARVFNVAASLTQDLGSEEMADTVKQMTLRYLREYCEPWVRQNGGYEAMLSEEDTECEVD